MRKVLVLQVIAMLGLLSPGCYYDKEELLYPDTGCDTAQVTFTGTIAPLISNQCKVCHSAAVASGGVALETHAQVKTWVDNGRLLSAIKHAPGVQPMPKGAPKLDACTINKIQTWANSGSPNN